MNTGYANPDNTYEQIAIDLAELIDQVSERGDLHRLLTSAYEAAYRKAAEDIKQGQLPQ